jgi:putative transcriptional regulator
MIGIAAMAVQFRLDKLLEEREGKPDAITQSELARKSGVTFATVNAIANNRTRQVHLDTLDKLCKALGVEPGALLEQKRGRG